MAPTLPCLVSSTYVNDDTSRIRVLILPSSNTGKMFSPDETSFSNAIGQMGFHPICKTTGQSPGERRSYDGFLMTA